MRLHNAEILTCLFDQHIPEHIWQDEADCLNCQHNRNPLKYENYYNYLFVTHLYTVEPGCKRKPNVEYF